MMVTIALKREMCYVRPFQVFSTFSIPRQIGLSMKIKNKHKYLPQSNVLLKFDKTWTKILHALGFTIWGEDKDAYMLISIQSRENTQLMIKDFINVLYLK